MKENISTNSMDQRRGSYRWKVIMPMLLIMYLFAYLDRTNISFAMTGMQNTFSITSTVSGFISGVFFFGYMLLQMPAGHLASRSSAKRNILILGFFTGLFATLQGVVNDVPTFIVVRFLLGVAEGGMLPTMYVLIANWFPERERGRATSTFALYQTLAPLIMSPISGLIVASSWLDFPGWRWMFIFEGLAPLVFAFIFYLIVPDHPEKAKSKGLGEEERRYLLEELDKEQKKPKIIQEKSYWRAALNWNFIFLTLSWGAMVIGNYGVSMWLPVIIKGISHYGYTKIGFISALPWLAATFGMILTGIINDKWGNKRSLLFILEAIAGICLFSTALIGTSNFILSIVFISLTLMASASATAVYLTALSELFPANMLGGLTGIFSAIGNLGGFFGPFIVGALMSGGNKIAGLLFLSGIYIISAILVTLVKLRKKSTDVPSNLTQVQ
ncbi:MFS transporter [Peribacillus simplex]|uniref:MFS transporter n=1 Tax=Peribacillus simplex TaxID=1478 RepID=UPI0011A0E60D|nr:MFS transporter [Peribacillus simplex]